MAIAPGVHALRPDAYHLDPCPKPSLSASIAKLLIEASPRHAWHAHPRLNPGHEPEEATQFDIGSAAHTLLLRDERALTVIAADSYRTKEAKALRDAARLAGSIPILEKHYDDVRRMADAARTQLAAHEASDAFTDGKPEQTLIHEDAGTWFRSMLDWLPAKGSIFYDYKSTGGSASPELWRRSIFDRGYDVQAAFYRRMIRAVLGGVQEPRFRFVIQETTPPYCLSVIALAPDAVDLAERKVDEAIRIWRWCMERDSWPGYPAHVCYVDAPPWQEARQMEREVVREQYEGNDMGRLVDWQAPLGNER